MVNVRCFFGIHDWEEAQPDSSRSRVLVENPGIVGHLPLPGRICVHCGLVRGIPPRPRPKALPRDGDNPPAEMLSQAASKRPSITLELRDVAGTDMFLFQEPVTLDAIQRVEDACRALAVKRRGRNGGGGLSGGTMC